MTFGEATMSCSEEQRGWKCMGHITAVELQQCWLCPWQGRHRWGMKHPHCFFGASLTTILCSQLLLLLKSGNQVCVRISHACP